VSPNSLAGRLGALRARIAAASRPVPDDLALRLTVADAWWLEQLFVELETQRYNITQPPRPEVLVTTTGEERPAA
jgi:hypothetical protein